MFFRAYGIHFVVQSVKFNIFAAAAIKEIIIMTTILIFIPIYKKVTYF